MPLPTMTTSQSASYLAEGSLERDMNPILYNIAPDSTPFLSSMPELERAVEMKIEWQTDELRPPQKNQRPEFDEYEFPMAPGVGRAANYCQIFSVAGKVSDVMTMVNKTYRPQKDEYTRQIAKNLKAIAKDMEYALMTNDKAQPESASAELAMMGGIPYFMNEEKISVTLSGSSATITAASPHRLETGRWVVFKGSTLPPEIEPQTRYYVRLDDSTPTTKFTIHNSLNEAIENKNAIAPSTTGTDVAIVLNNVIDAGGDKFTLDHINDAVELAYSRGGNPTEVWMSAKQKRRFSQLLTAVHTVNKNQSDKTVTDINNVYETDFGVITARVHRDCDESKMFLLDRSYWGTRWLDKTHKIEDSQLAKTGSYKKFVITGIFSMQASQPLSSAAIMNIGRP